MPRGKSKGLNMKFSKMLRNKEDWSCILQTAVGLDEKVGAAEK